MLFRKANEHSILSQADILRDQGDWQAAARKYEQVLGENPQLAHIWVQYGHSLKESGFYAEAEEAYKKAIALVPSADSFLQLGHLYKISDNKQSAEESYLAAYDKDGQSSYILTELEAFGWSKARLRVRKAEASTHPDTRHAGAGTIALEITDLVDFLTHGFQPTGIQRVQLELAEIFYSDSDVIIIYYNDELARFSEITPGQLRRLFDIYSGDQRSRAMRQEVGRRLQREITTADPLTFPNGSTVVNVGTSWGYRNYFMVLRELKKRDKVRYVPFVHDTIPVLFPEYCDDNLVRDFISWVDGMTLHADMVLANSQNTRLDLENVCKRLSRQLPPVHVLLLNGDTRSRETSNPEDVRQADMLLRANNLDVQNYVLMVSTIEPRKNHSLALNTWSRMLKQDDGRSIPLLVCVGSPGWKNEGFYDRLNQNSALAEKVVVLTNVSNEALKRLYQSSLFTIFPSLYEGWGLPISEALSYGKIPLVSRVSAHPEAGGDLAVYFDLDSEANFQGELEKLIFDVAHRESLERKLSEAIPLRSWAEIGSELLTSVRISQTDFSADIPSITTGRYYGFVRNKERQISRFLFSAEAFRSGINWYSLEDWGVWIQGGTAELQFRLPETADAFTLYLHFAIPGENGKISDVNLTLLNAKWSVTTQMRQSSNPWRTIDFRVAPESARHVALRISAGPIIKFGELGNSDDPRSSALGLRGLYLARSESDVERRTLVEAIQLDDLERLQRACIAPAVI